MDTILIQTKLHPPQLSSQIVARPHLIQRLNQYKQRPLTLVSASAGYGKSTLISCWLKTIDTPSAWLSLDEYDDEMPVFLTYFIAAVQTIFPDALQKTQSLVNAATHPPLSILMSSLVNEIQEIAKPFILVLDDLHVIRDASIHALLHELFRYPSRAIHLVIITRRDPPLPINRMRARAQLTEIRSLELRFTEAETAVFLQKMGIQIDNATIADLTEKTEGWATGLRLSALSMRHRGAEFPLTKAPDKIHYVTDYLVAETLSELPPQITQFLLQTSILDRLCSSLCDAILADRNTVSLDSEAMENTFTDSQIILEWLYEQNLFIIPLDDHQEWYRYHHLFQELLQTQLKQSIEAEAVNELHLQASRWLSQNGLIDEALRHRMAAGDANGAADIVEHHKYAVLENGRWPILERWLNQLPDETVQQRPKLLLGKAWTLNFQGAYEKIPAILQTLEHLLKKERLAPELEGDLSYFEALLLYWDWQIEPSLTLFRHAVEKIPRVNLGGRNEAEIYLALASQMAGQEAEITRMYRKMQREDTSNSPRKGYLLTSLAFVYVLAGKLVSVHEMAQQIVTFGFQTKNDLVSGWGSYFMGYVHYQWDDLETAVIHFNQALQKRFLLDVNTPIDCYAGLIFAYQGLQQRQKALETVEQMVEFAQQTQNPLHTVLARSVQTRLHLLQGDALSASRRIESVDLAADEGTMFFWLEQPRITTCRVLMADGSENNLQAAAERLQIYWQMCHATHNTPRMIEILLLQAEVFCKQSMLGKAKTVLEKAVQLGEIGEYKRPFVKLSPELINILIELYNQGVCSNYLKKLNINHQQPTNGQDKQGNALAKLPEPLTNREQDVLALLAKRFTNKEIAEQLYISPLTVKKYTVNIYQKLSVQNRRQAADKAMALGLVSESFN